MSSLLAPFKALLIFLVRNKGKIVLYVFFVFIFLFFLFPFNDLGDLVSTQVSKITSNQFYVGFDHLKMSVYPNPGLELNQVVLETPFAPSLSVQQITVLPSTQGLIAQKPYGRISILGILDGNLDLKVGKGPKTEKGTERLKLDLKVQKMNIQDIRRLTHLPLMLKGQLNLDSQILTDLAMVEPPEVSDLTLRIDQFEIPALSLDLNGLPLSTPGIKLSQVDLKGRYSEGFFYIESSSLGKSNDEFGGQIKGKLQLNFIPNSQGPQASLGAYDLTLSLKAKKSFVDKMQLIGIFQGDSNYGRFFKTVPDGIEFKARLTGMGLGPQPQMSPIQ